MASDKLRLVIAAALLLGAGALGALSRDSARLWSGVLLLVAMGATIAWPLARGRPAVPMPTDSPRTDSNRLATLEAQLDHLPVAVWLDAGGRLQPLTSRAHRLCAPGSVRDPDALFQLLRNEAHDGPVIVDTESGSERWQLTRQSLAIEGVAQTLIALIPLERQLESESLQAWQQLLRVLTHEIMNSLTPIRSLSDTAVQLLRSPGSEADLQTALDSIARRAASLATFVSNYRRVSEWPAPELAPVDVAALFKRIGHGVTPVWLARGGSARFEAAEPTVRLMADEGQLEQVLLALIRNAELATAEIEAPSLYVLARLGRGGRLQISVRDNGPGVPYGLERQIFLPFFSARDGGQGIGLTVVRQLMLGMGGRVRHVRPLEGGAMFVLVF